MSESNLPPLANEAGYVPVDYVPQRPTSVTVLAIIGIVLAALTLILCTPMSIVPYFIPAMEKSSPALGEIKSNHPLFAFVIGSVALGVVVNLYLLFACIGSLRLRKWARPAMLAFAVIFILMMFVNMTVQVLYVFPITTNPAYFPPEAQKAAGMMKSFTYGGAACMAVLFLLYPIAILIFYTRRNVVDAFERRLTL